MLASALAFFASARGFQEGEAVPVIACTSTAANITVITGGIVVFGDALAGGVLLAVQIVAFALVAVAALVTPAGHGKRRHGVATLSGLRRILVVLVLVLLASAAPAQAAPRPLAYSQSGMRSALAGDLAIFTRGSGAYAVPTAGGPARRILSFSAEAASAATGGVGHSRGHHDRQRRARARARPGVHGAARAAPGPSSMVRRPSLQVDGDRLYTLALGSTIDSSSVTVRDPDPHTVPFPTGRDAIGAVFAGDLVAYATDDRFVVRDWRTGAQRTVAELPDRAASIDLRDDGRALVATDDGELLDVPPGGVPRRIARSARNPRFAGEHIVFIRGPRPTAPAACASSIRAAACARSASPLRDSATSRPTALACSGKPTTACSWRR